MVTTLDHVFREEWGRVLATLIGFLGDFDFAEEAAQEAFAIAGQRSWQPPQARVSRRSAPARLPDAGGGIRRNGNLSSRAGGQAGRWPYPPAPNRIRGPYVLGSKADTDRGAVRTWEEALTRLVAERGAALKRYAFVLCGDDAEADDLLQDGLVRAFTRPSQGRSDGEVEGYVRRIILNRFLDERRRLSRWRRLVPVLAWPESQHDETATIADRDHFRTALATLSPRQRACLALRYYGDQSVAQIAEQLGCSEGAVKRYLSDGTDRLRQRLRNPDQGDVLTWTNS